MDVHVLSEEKDYFEVEFVDEGHTLCNFLRQELWENKDVQLASYRIKHPQIGSPILKVQAPKPRKVLLAVIASAQAKVKSLQVKVAKL